MKTLFLSLAFLSSISAFGADYSCTLNNKVKFDLEVGKITHLNLGEGKVEVKLARYRQDDPQSLILSAKNNDPRRYSMQSINVEVSNQQNNIFASTFYGESNIYDLFLEQLTVRCDKL